MPRLRASRYLTCFYCGKRSGNKNDGTLKQFTCTSCDATNHLDANGEITDPPVATTREAPATQYTVSQSSPTHPREDSIFCPTCIKNQHLFTASLAQYLPDDPDSPDYRQLERNYYRYRKTLEARYPQVCEDCAKRVDGKMQQATYTAKTDHLRRMMTQSRGRKAPARTSALDVISNTGRWLWWAGFVLQMLWHISVTSEALEQTDDGMYDPDDESISTKAVALVKTVVQIMPGPGTLIQCSLMASILCVWWNPHFVQFNRGFTRHLMGFTQWYSFQGLIIFLRFFFTRVLHMEGGQVQSRSAYLSTHIAMAVVMSLLYFQASRSIQVDTTPLFGTYEGSVSPKQVMTPVKKKNSDATKSFSDQLGEALDAPSQPLSEVTRQAQLSSRPARDSFNPSRASGSQKLGLNSMGLGESTPQRAQSQYGDEMDWTPTQSQHRAFSPTSNFSSAKTDQRLQFGQAPTQPDGPTFWYKVPPAPVNPAHRLRNPTNAPFIRNKLENRESPLFSGPKGGQEKTNVDNRGVSFEPPKFFAPQAQGLNDEANSLADLLGQNFTLGQNQDDEPETSQRSSKKTGRGKTPGQIKRSGAVESCILAILVALWLVASFVETPYGIESQLATLAIAGVLALRLTGETNKTIGEDKPPGVAAYGGALLGVAELSALCWIGWEAWSGEMDVGSYGIGVLGVMLGHQVWNMAM